MWAYNVVEAAWKPALWNLFDKDESANEVERARELKEPVMREGKGRLRQAAATTCDALSTPPKKY